MVCVDFESRMMVTQTVSVCPIVLVFVSSTSLLCNPVLNSLQLPQLQVASWPVLCLVLFWLAQLSLVSLSTSLEKRTRGMEHLSCPKITSCTSRLRETQPVAKTRGAVGGSCKQFLWRFVTGLDTSRVSRLMSSVCEVSKIMWLRIHKISTGVYSKNDGKDGKGWQEL
eukprot:1010257-Amphidinium_carterae.1